MVSLETIRMIVSLAAGSDMPLFSTDFSQAVPNADLDHPHLYCGLPTLPPEMRGGAFGMSGRTKVAHVHKAWYGLPQSPRCWQQHLMAFYWIRKSLGLSFSSTTVMPSGGNGKAIGSSGGIHVGDVLFAVTSLEIRDEFMKRLNAEFRVTGGD